MIRIGHGYDCHRLIDGDRLILGGVEIPFHKKFQAHSDGDVVLHAVIDALLGAAGLGDIGKYFPDNDPRYENASSMGLLSATYQMLKKKKLKVINLDITIIAETPKLAAHKLAMQVNIAHALQMDIQFVNVKAKTNEGMDAIGEGEGIAVHAVVLLCIPIATEFS
ncbi:MAG: 2-C-methyl-D-erythritol 2,4-cyclodiphosphate synthase [Gammaproteobacteria bacterium RIFOXYB2_FULL_38_6]|nr:MAG: 2-C-methyl-D-erythritol 2,4-cyclodiphosphate synthase [Gammaproteobacteria bacterium RIFOXYB2_FULL_38_6]